MIKDDATATDDVEGEANIDDDQTMHFFKVTADQGGADDVFSRSVSYTRDFADDSGAADSPTLSLGKALEDQSTGDDSATLSVGKTIADDPSASDQPVLTTSKPISEQTHVSDSPELSLNAPKSDTAGADDDLTLQVGKGISDQSGAADEFVRSFDKAIEDQSGAGDDPVFSFGKQIADESGADDSFSRAVTYNRSADQVRSTDDVNGALAGDDQTMHFTKVTADQGPPMILTTVALTELYPMVRAHLIVRFDISKPQGDDANARFFSLFCRIQQDIGGSGQCDG